MHKLNHQLIQTFYTAFANRDLDTMLNCYHENVIYDDVGFGKQQGKNAKAVWHFLIKKGDKEASVLYSNITTTKTSGSAKWIAIYKLNNRQIENHVSATFRFQNGKIIYHKDNYSLWKWSHQAFGFLGFLVGWSPLFLWLIRWQMQKKLINFLS